MQVAAEEVNQAQELLEQGDQVEAETAQKMRELLETAQ
jgi:hypothetical protein